MQATGSRSSSQGNPPRRSVRRMGFRRRGPGGYLVPAGAAAGTVSTSPSRLWRRFPPWLQAPAAGPGTGSFRRKDPVLGPVRSASVGSDSAGARSGLEAEGSGSEADRSGFAGDGSGSALGYGEPKESDEGLAVLEAHYRSTPNRRAWRLPPCQGGSRRFEPVHPLQAAGLEPPTSSGFGAGGPSSPTASRGTYGR